MSDAPIVGSVAFELRVTKAKVKADLEAAKREAQDAARQASDALDKGLSDGADKGAKKAAKSMGEAAGAGKTAGEEIRNAMSKAGAEIGDAVERGTKKAKRELDDLARKAKQIQLPAPTIPTSETHRLDTNPINGVQSWVPLGFDKESRVDRNARMGIAPAPGSYAPVPAISAPEVKKTAEEVEKLTENLDGLAKKTGQADVAGRDMTRSSGLLAAGLTGIATAAAAVTFKAIFDGAREAARVGAEIANTADSLGIGVVRLQELRFAADETRTPIAALEGGLGRLKQLLQDFRAGTADRDLKPIFDQMGISAADIAKLDDADGFLRLIAERIKNVGNEAKQADVLGQLGIAGLANLTKDGVDELDRLGGAARDTGVVLNQELIESLRQADDKMRVSGQQIDALRVQAFAPLVGVIGDAASAALNYANEMDKVAKKSPGWVNAIRQGLLALPGGIGNLAMPIFNNLTYPFRERGRTPLPAEQPSAPDVDGGGYAPPRAPRTPRARASGPSAAEQAKRLADIRTEMAASVELTVARLNRDTDLIESLERQAEIRQRIRQLEAAGVTSATAQAEAADLQLKIDEARSAVKAREAEEQQKAVASAELVHRIDVARLSGNEELLRQLSDERAIEERTEFWIRQKLTAENARLVAKRELAELEAASAGSAERAARAEQKRHDLEIAQARGDFATASRLGNEAEIDRRAESYYRNGRGTISRETARARAEQEVAELNAALREGDLRESFRYEFTDAMRAAIDGDIGSAFERLADRFRTRLLDNLADGIFDLLKGARSSGGSGGGGWLASISNIFSRLPKFATGGSILPGGSGGIDSQLVAFWKSPGEQVDIYDPASARGGARIASSGGAYFDLRGAVMTDDLLRQMNRIGQVQSDRAYGRSMTDAPKLTMAQTARQQQSAAGRKRR